jgi:hypothetical protein
LPADEALRGEDLRSLELLAHAGSTPDPPPAVVPHPALDQMPRPAAGAERKQVVRVAWFRVLEAGTRATWPSHGGAGWSAAQFSSRELL